MEKEYLNHSVDYRDFDLVSIYDDLPLWSAPFGLKLLERVKVAKGLTVLDIGSGTGFPLLELAERLGETCKVFGIDLWEEAIQRINLKIIKKDIKNVSVLNCSAESMSFDSNFFDLIVSNNGINNVSNQTKAFSECFRTLKERGQLIFTYNLPGTMAEFYDLFLEVANQIDTFYGEKIREHIYSKRKPVKYYDELLKDIGFQIKSISNDKFIYRFADGTTMLNYFFIKLAFLGSWKDILKTEEVEKVFTIMENRLNQIAVQKGELILTIPYVCVDCIKK